MGPCDIPLIGRSLVRLWIRFAGAAAIRRMQERRDRCGLIAALEAEDPEVRYRAVEALGGMHDPAAIPALVRCLAGEEQSGLRYKAAEALGAIGPAAVQPLVPLLSSTDEDVRWMTALALGATRDGTAVDPLVAHLRDPDRFVRRRAAVALGMIGAAAVPSLAVALTDPDLDLRRGAAAALGLIRDRSALPLLIEALKDPDEEVRAGVLAALAEFGGDAAEHLAAQIGGSPVSDAEIRRLLAALDTAPDQGKYK